MSKQGNIINVSELSIEEYHEQLFDHICQILRAKDLLNVTLYFFNTRLDDDNIVKNLENKNAYITIRIPQQHRGEEVLKTYPVEPLKSSKVFSSGFSYITFEILFADDKLYYDAENLLAWNNQEKFKLIDTPKVIGYPNYKLAKLEKLYNDVNSSYPFEISSNPLDHPFLFKSDSGIRIPVTLFELPYKMYLSPILPETGENSEFTFAYNNNKNLLLDLSVEGDNSSVEVFEIWNNDLGFKVDKFSNELKSPSFKILGYANEDRTPQSPEEGIISDSNVCLLPNPKKSHREHLAALSRLGYEEIEENVWKRDYMRDIQSDYFNISGLGASTYLKYDHPDPKVYDTEGNEIDNFLIKSWKQDIKLGCDNYVEIVTRGVDSNTGLKLLISDISERLIIGKVCFLKERKQFKYLEREKSYDTKDFRYKTPYKYVKALEEGRFFTPHILGDNICSVCEEENNTTIGEYPNKVLKLKYQVTDWNDQIHEIESDVIIIGEKVFKDADSTTIDTAIRDVINAKVKENRTHSIKFKNKFAVANSFSLDSISDKVAKDVEFESNEVLLYPEVFSYDNLDAPYPLVPVLFYLKGAIPQLNGLESVPSIHYLTYAKTYKETGFQSNISKIFFKRLSDDFLDGFSLSNGEKITQNFFNKNEESYSNFMSKDHTSFGPIGNSNSSCEGVFLKEQALVLNEDINRGIEALDFNDDLSKVTFKPTDFLGIDVELMGGVKFKDILMDALGLPDLPVIKAVEDIKKDVEEIKAILKDYQYIYNQYEAKYKELKALIENFPANLRTLEKQLINAAREQVITIANRWIERQVDELYVKVVDEIENDASIQTFIHNVYKYENLYSILQNQVTTIKTIFDQGYAQLNTDIKFLSGISIKDLNKKETLKLYNEAKKRTEDFIRKLVTELKKLHEISQGTSDKKAVENSIISAAYIVVQHYLYQLAQQENVNLKSLLKVLKDIKKVARHQKIVDVLINVTNDVYRYTPKYLEDLKKEITFEVKIRKKEIEDELSTAIQNTIYEINENIKPYLLLYEVMISYQNRYYEFLDRFKELEKLSKDFGFQLQNGDLTDIKYLKYLNDTLPELSKKIISQIQFILQSPEFKEMFPEATNIFDEDTFKTFYDRLLQIDPQDKEAIKQLSQILKDLEKYINEKRLFYENRVDEEKSKILKKIKELKDSFDNAKKELEDAPKSILEQLKVKLEEAIGSNNVAKYKKIKKIIETIQATKEKTIDYTWQTTKFKNYKSGLVRFIKKSNPPTSFSIDFKATTQFDISLGAPPKINGYTYGMVNRLSNFGIGLGQIIVNFDELRYEKGSSSGTDFSVKIRNVQFEGIMNFIKVFQDYLQTIDKSLILRVTEEGAMVGYSVPLPNLLFGYINFFQLKLSMAIVLPFLPKKPTLVKIGINNPSDRFIITVNGYMGTGYFETVLNPKVGLVSIAFVVEFEAKLSMRLPGAKGYAHLLAGFYFRKIHDTIELKGNLHLSGGFNIINLFHSSIVFDMTLIGNADYLEGYTNVKVSHRFSRWFKVSVRIHYRQKFYGTKRQHSGASGFSAFSNDRNVLKLNNDLEILDSNFYSKNSNYFNINNRPWLIVRYPRGKVYKMKVAWKKSNGNYTDPNDRGINSKILYKDADYTYRKITLYKRNNNKIVFKVLVDYKNEEHTIYENNYYHRRTGSSNNLVLPDGAIASKFYNHYMSYL